MRGALARRLPLHLAAAIALCAAWALAGCALSYALFGAFPYGGGAYDWFLTSLPFGVAVYFAVLGVEHALFYFVEARARETRPPVSRPSSPRRGWARCAPSSSRTSCSTASTPSR